MQVADKERWRFFGILHGLSKVPNQPCPNHSRLTFTWGYWQAVIVKVVVSKSWNFFIHSGCPILLCIGRKIIRYTSTIFIRSSIDFSAFPTIISSLCQPQPFTCLCTGGTVWYGFVDQLYCFFFPLQFMFCQ